MTRAQRGRPVGASGEETRRRIVAATMRCVAEAGHTRATIREIARGAGMTSASLYHYFANKSELLEATVSEMDAIALPRLRAAAAQPDNVVDRLAAVLDESSRLMRDYPDLAAFERAMRVIGHQPGDRLRQPGPKALRAIIAEVIEDARAQGELPVGTEPRAAVNAIHALARGLTERAASLSPDAYAATLDSAKGLLRGTLFTDGRQ
ncbi:TetR family transcriptional regulator [Mycobacterium colombiense]|uniref:TetR family transcriptional regulator n=1 Tax=Mycobacterium colombiense TaxID=339268 RepID=A0A1A2RV83_9MYCO|nr:TetR/AcrR family transcriptional regulator [Mycobacterium colombiense]OBH55655.1 TetR family transcriptional regulator [Mycobacterium colombiense]